MTSCQKIRNRISLITFIVLTISITGGVAQTNSSPNIIYILADDLGYGDLSCYGQSLFETPHLDQLAEGGMMFLSHYSGSTVCAPSRSALLTGLHTGHTPVRGNKEVKPEGQWPLPPDTYTLPEMLKERGYVTGAFGKWGLGYPGSEGDPNQQGFDEFFGYNCQRLAHNYYPRYLWHNQEKVTLEGNDGTGTGVYAPIEIHRQALQFLEANRDTSFFLFYPTPIPHAELLVPDEYLEPFSRKFPPEITYEGVDDGDNYRLGPYGSQDQCHAAFAGMITLLDQQVGEIMHRVRELGLEDNTLIIFTSDNGPHMEGGADPDYFNSNGVYKGYKRDLYEGGIRVPMIAYWPGQIAPGSETDHPSAFWDVFPTLEELTGTVPTSNLDGVSFLPTLTGSSTQQSHDYLYWEFHERGGRRALRQGPWKIVQYNVNADPPGDFELYNLTRDPGEESDLSGMEKEKLEALKELLINARTESSVFQFASTAYDAEK